MTFRTLREGELDAWALHCSQVFAGPTDTPEFFLGHYRADPYRDPEGVFIAEDKGQIVSTVRVFEREMYLRGRRIRMGGIGEVSTKQEYRRQGLSGALLERATEYMVRRDMPISLLFTRSNSHYARYGWFTVMTRWASVDLLNQPALPEGYSLRRMERADIPAMRGLNGLTASRFDGAIVRDHPAFWEAWLPDAWKAPQVLTCADRVVAFLDARLEREQGRLALIDYASEPQGEWWLPMLAESARMLELPLRGYVPAPLLPNYNGPFGESGHEMFRLNAPFLLEGERVETAGQLAALLAHSLFWDPDGY